MITWSDIIRPKISTSNPKLTGFTKAISITDINQPNQIILDNLSTEQIILLLNFSQDTRLRIKLVNVSDCDSLCKASELRVTGADLGLCDIKPCDPIAFERRR
jgi:hypothetical protein